VSIPFSLLPGQAGGIFSEFGFVFTFCVLLSSFVAQTLALVLAAPAIAIGAAVAIVSFGTYSNLSSTLTPVEDRGAFFIRGTAPSAASLSFKDEQMQKVEAFCSPMLTAERSQPCKR